MRRCFLTILTLACAFSSAALAQSKSSVFGGFSYLNGSNDLYYPNSNSPELLGWDASYTYKIAPRFGLTADFGGNYGPANNFGFSTGNFMQHTLMGGGEFTALNFGRMQVNLRALAGASRLTTPYPDFFIDSNGNGSNSQVAFSSAFGGSVDVKITPRVSWRIVQPEYLLTRFGGTYQDNFRLSTGIVFRFGD